MATSQKTSFRNIFFLYLTVQGLWLAWSGHFEPMMLGLGLVSALGVVWLCYKMGIVDDEIIPLHLTVRTLRYVPWLAVEVVKSNVAVIKRVLGPRRNIRPTMVTVPSSQKTALGRTTYANSITLTPGTLTVEAVDDQITVHSIDRETVASLQTGEMDRRVTLVEGHKVSPEASE